MAEYTVDPIPVLKAMQINTPADGEAWIASLTDNELVSEGLVYSDLRFEFVEGSGTMWLKGTVTSEVGSEPFGFDTDIGGYAIADTNRGVHIWLEDNANFTRRYQPYPVQV